MGIVPVGLSATGMRVERDSMGEIAVPAEHYWGAQTQRSLEHFAIGDDLLPIEIARALGLVKKVAARVNASLSLLPADKAALIVQVADEIINGLLDAEFPLRIWQSGSGTHTNMNVNEVIANRAAQIAGAPLGGKTPLHPNDDVNLSQSSNDTFPTALHIAALSAIDDHLLPRVEALAAAIAAHAATWADVVKIGRTHLQDAVPLTVGQEWTGYATQIVDAIARIRDSRRELMHIAAGGTAVGTGLNAPRDFGDRFAAELSALTGRTFASAPDKFSALAASDACVNAMAALRSLAIALMKIGNDLRWLASGPRCGLGELRLPENEPGSSIMPGKVNPSQCEAVLMVAVEVLASDHAVAIAGTQGNFELNTMRPLIAGKLLHTIRILGDACESFRRYCIDGIEIDRTRIALTVERSLMLVTALVPEIGYDRAAAIARRAHAEGLTLREAALAAGVSAERFDAIVDARRMIPGSDV